ncbi:hypothetical protein [Ferrimonas aestuarii]|uniref:Transmembrane anchor protein n=1 Tax=Ferrimonas aestuarii TaxID=2569539 RepID=A0A4U1BNJ8_9GAMM|nr:hypothetical protein [Ferrimonas aestuarii]TKB54730.1 hypothetical protein FCL42_11305 [Ferrimonas aestuarii]
MSEFNAPVYSVSTLVKATVAAAGIAAVVLVSCILPAEYNIDPTGLGKAMGLTELAEAAATPPVVDLKQQLKSPQVLAERSDQVTVTVAPGKGIEYKLLMEQYGHLEYQWKTDGVELYFDFHGEPKGDTTGYFESFAITTSDGMKGSLTAPWAGSHGWYWKNNSDQAVVVTLFMKGNYTIKG